MNNYQLEQLENIRRACEGAKKGLEGWHGRATDSFNHILNLVELIKENNDDRCRHETSR